MSFSYPILRSPSRQSRLLFEPHAPHSPEPAPARPPLGLRVTARQRDPCPWGDAAGGRHRVPVRVRPARIKFRRRKGTAMWIFSPRCSRRWRALFRRPLIAGSSVWSTRSRAHHPVRGVIQPAAHHLDAAQRDPPRSPCHRRGGAGGRREPRHDPAPHHRPLAAPAIAATAMLSVFLSWKRVPVRADPHAVGGPAPRRSRSTSSRRCTAPSGKPHRRGPTLVVLPILATALPLAGASSPASRSGGQRPAARDRPTTQGGVPMKAAASGSGAARGR